MIDICTSSPTIIAYLDILVWYQPLYLDIFPSQAGGTQVVVVCLSGDCRVSSVISRHPHVTLRHRAQPEQQYLGYIGVICPSQYLSNQARALSLE